MDSSRDADLRGLKAIFDNPLKPLDVRKAAYESFQNIQRQMGDRKLADMRSRLIRAIKANDTKAIANIEEQIHEYARKQGYEKPAMG